MGALDPRAWWTWPGCCLGSSRRCCRRAAGVILEPSELEPELLSESSRSIPVCGAWRQNAAQASSPAEKNTRYYFVKGASALLLIPWRRALVLFDKRLNSVVWRRGLTAITKMLSKFLTSGMYLPSQFPGVNSLGGAGET